MNRINDKLSIIITAYNAQDYIEYCLDSIANQKNIDFNNIEILIGIDGCHKTKNRLLPIVSKYKFKLKIVFFRPNVGTYVVSNTLMKMAKHPNLLRFDSDDVMLEDMIYRILCVDKHYDFMRFGFYNFNRNDHTVKQLYLKPSHGCTFLTKKLFTYSGGYLPWRCGADNEFFIRCSSIMNQHIITKPIFMRRRHDESLTMNKITGYDSPARLEAISKLNDNFNLGIIKIDTVTEENYIIL